MYDDLTVPIGDGFVNIRVGAVIMRGGRFLMTGSEDADYLYSVGGRVQFGETAEEAIVREVFEETGTRLDIDRLGFVHENYFVAHYPENRRGKLFYELSFFFYMLVPPDFEPVCASFDDGGSKEFLVWAAPDEPRNLYPEFFRTELLHPSEGVKHIVNDERGIRHA